MGLKTYNKNKLDVSIECEEYMKRYYNDNKEAILIKLKTKVKCPICDKEISKVHLKRHEKTKMCMNIKKQYGLIDNI